MEKKFDLVRNFIDDCIEEDIGAGKASYGKICTRVPPEPNGYLHIGSAEAIYTNWMIGQR